MKLSFLGVGGFQAVTPEIEKNEFKAARLWPIY